MEVAVAAVEVAGSSGSSGGAVALEPSDNHNNSNPITIDSKI